MITTMAEFSNLDYHFSAIASVFTDLAPRLGCWFASRTLHHKMLTRIMQVPVAFFDITPTGRILARFSKDIDDIDIHLPFIIADGIYCYFEV